MTIFYDKGDGYYRDQSGKIVGYRAVGEKANLLKEFLEFKPDAHDDQVDAYSYIAEFLNRQKLPWWKRLWRWLMKKLD